MDNTLIVEVVMVLVEVVVVVVVEVVVVVVVAVKISTCPPQSASTLNTPIIMRAASLYELNTFLIQ